MALKRQPVGVDSRLNGPYLSRMNDQANRWRELASRLGLRVVAPATLDLRGESVLFTGLQG
jgi:hypothetical protein